MKDGGIFIAKQMERWSLDAVGVAVVWYMALAETIGRNAVLAEAVVLALATWLTYVADRLRDAQSGASKVETDRHLYYRNHYTLFVRLWWVGFVLSLLAAFFFLSLNKVMGGMALVALIILYLGYIRKLTPSGKRLFMKRLLVPFIFVAGIGWLAEAWGSVAGWFALVTLWIAAFANLLLISIEENFSQPPEWLNPLTGKALLAMLIVSNAALLITWPLGVAGLFCALAYFILFMRLKAARVPMIRAWVDGVLSLAGVLLYLLG